MLSLLIVAILRSSTRAATRILSTLFLVMQPGWSTGVLSKSSTLFDPYNHDDLYPRSASLSCDGVMAFQSPTRRFLFCITKARTSFNLTRLG